MGGRSGGRQGRLRPVVMLGLAAAAVGLAGLDLPEHSQPSPPSSEGPLHGAGSAYSSRLVLRHHDGGSLLSRPGAGASPLGQGPGDRREAGRDDDAGGDSADDPADGSSDEHGGGRGGHGGQAGGDRTPTAPTVPTSSTSPGRWSPTIDLPLVPTGVAMIPGNRLMMWSAYSGDDASGQQTQTAVLDLDTLTVTSTTTAGSEAELLGPGVTSLSDGRLLVAGGGASAKVSLFNPYVDAWSAALDPAGALDDLGVAQLPDGRAVAVGGPGQDGTAQPAEVWTSGEGWAALPGTDTTTDDGTGRRWLFPVGDDEVLQLGPSRTMDLISLDGDGSVTPVGERLATDVGDGTAVLYDSDRVLVLGGATHRSPAVGAAYVVDLSGDQPTARPTGSLNQASTFTNSVVLPDGEVLAMGGRGTQLDPEVWDPASGTWQVGAPSSVPHNDRSVLVLLPDGRVFAGGGCGSCSSDDVNGQVYTPGYLLNDDGSLRERPEVTANPYTMDVGSTVTVTTDSAVDSFALVRMAASTDTVDNDQRRVPLEIVDSTPQPDGSVTYRLEVPSDASVALPGNYLFFALDDRGTPSRSQQVNIPLG